MDVERVGVRRRKERLLGLRRLTWMSLGTKVSVPFRLVLRWFRVEAVAVEVWWESCCFFRNLDIKFMAGAGKGGTECLSLRGSVIM